MKWGLKGGISIYADSGTPRHVLWCCGGIFHQPDTFIKIGCGHSVKGDIFYEIYFNYLSLFLFFSEIPVAMPDPQPGIHLAVSRTRLGQLNDQEYNAKLTNAVRSIIAQQDSEFNSKDLKVFVLSEQSLLPLIVAKILNKKGKVICFELNEQFRHVLNGVSKENDLKDTLEIRKDIENYCDITAEVIKEDIDVIFAEPSFGISLLPWHNLFYW